MWSSLSFSLNIFWRLSKKHLWLYRDQDIILRVACEMIVRTNYSFKKEQCRFCIFKTFYSEVLTLLIIIICQMKIKYFGQFGCNWNVSGMLNWMKTFHFESADTDCNFAFWECWFWVITCNARVIAYW